MLNGLKRFVQHIRERNTCKCSSPTYVVGGGLLACKACGKPISQSFINELLNQPSARKE